ncbi:MAG: F0F1 ATP synthase subunit alpha [Lachnospiraceae bacterium]|nr:F0F1 ATP synthase subunit alpha [Lachnospiraceae bacterium]
MAEVLEAVLYSDVPPSDEQTLRFEKFLKNKYGQDLTLKWVEDPSINAGFKLAVGAEVYDWSRDGLFRQLSERLSKRVNSKDTIPLLTKALEDWELEILPQETGNVTRVGDGIAMLDGLKNVAYGEIVIFENGAKGMVQNLKENEVGCLVFDADERIMAGSSVRRTGRTASMPVGDKFLGRVVTALGAPMDGKGPITAEDYYPIEKRAPGIIDRQPVNQPLNTGLLVIDSMFPIGRGQRELIIGDRQTGKTAIALDTIINQKGKNCICIYVAIGQKTSNVVQVYETLKRHKADEYSVIVAANAGDSDSLQYIAPYAGCALAEYFMDKGKDVLIVYDDLSKHAVAYRAISLLFERPPGREAFPGDIFYLHSRLLERSAHLSEEKGGGSITALPIVETQGGDVSAYIPTNIISITDGQIYLERNLFFSGQRPAVNVGLSVSRVGGDAQTKAVKKAAGSLRLDLAQYREMEIFTQFSSDLDDVTKKQLAYGTGLMHILRQPQYSPYSQHRQVVLLVSATNKCMQDIDPDDMDTFVPELLTGFESAHGSLCREIDTTGQLSDETKKAIISYANKAAADFKKKIG